MKSNKTTSILSFILLFFAGASAQQPFEFTPDQKLRVAEAVIEKYYVEDVDSEELAAEAIRAMLKTLDPHSSYTTPEETLEFTQPLEGKFSGIGIQFNMLEDTVYVIQTTAGGPSERRGILPGDRIVSANDTVIAGRKLKNSDIIKVLRGPKGSLVRLGVRRGGEAELIEFDIIRDDIPVYSVDESFMADPTTGYIRVTRFAEDTAKEVADAMKKLRKQGMKNLIIDLSDNVGGYLGSAFQLASEFLGRDVPVVSTSGKNVPAQTFTTESNGTFLDGRVVVIVNQYSASASEILAGAMQDNDRGLIVGRRTFGKGLVQRPFPFPDGSMIRLTTSRYYTPSGRCIQKHYDKGHGEEYQLDMLNRYSSGELWSADSIQRPDSLRYATLRNGRTVYGGGGILPDVFVPADTSHYTPYYRDLMAKGIINRTCINYVDANRDELHKLYPNEDAFYAGFSMPSSLTDNLIARATEAGIEFNEEQWQRSRPTIEAIMKGLLCRDLYENGSYFRALAPLSKDFNEALRLINDTGRFNRLLQTGDEG